MNEKCWNIKIEITNKLKEEGVYLAFTCFQVYELSMKDYSEKWKNLINEIEELVKKKHTSPDTLKNDPIVKAYRKFFWNHGIDPTKTRPAGEALVRRILRNNKIKSIHPIVDAGNLASIITLISIGLYDIDKINPKQLYLKKAEGNEEFKPIGGEPYKIKKDTPILTNKKQVLHIFPHRDSIETMITPETRKVLGIAAGLQEIPPELATKSLQYTLSYLEKLGIKTIVHQKPTIIK